MFLTASNSEFVVIMEKSDKARVEEQKAPWYVEAWPNEAPKVFQYKQLLESERASQCSSHALSKKVKAGPTEPAEIVALPTVEHSSACGVDKPELGGLEWVGPYTLLGKDHVVCIGAAV